MNLKLVEVAVPCPLAQTFTYKSEVSIDPGVRVRVGFGPRQLIGIVVKDSLRKEGTAEIKYAPILDTLDPSPVLSENLMTLGYWISEYYMHPIGEVFKAMLPASQSVKRKEHWHLSKKGLAAVENRSKGSSEESEFLTKIFAKKDHLTRATLVAKLRKLAGESESSRSELTIEGLKKKGLIKQELKKDIAVKKMGAARSASQLKAMSPQSTPRILTQFQQKAFASITQRGLKAALSAQSSSPFLLHGITGSGKTEIYMQLIQFMLSENPGSQSLLLVPEISLTPQMTAAFVSRFGEQVAVVHSGLDSNRRWSQLESIRSGEKRVLIGPRSAVFANFMNLKLILVDEEHDPSYKQNAGLLYHGRDVAVARASIEKAAIVLGSATPSLESFYNSKIGKYCYLELRSRASGQTLPLVSVIENTGRAPAFAIETKSRDSTLPPDLTGKNQPLAPQIIEALKENIEKGHQSIVLVNRRGFAFFLLDTKTQEPVECPNCSISLTLHKKKQTLKCHYCDFKSFVNQYVSGTEQERFIAIGFGSQHAEDYLAACLPEAKIARLDSDVTTQRGHLDRTLAKFREGKLDILVGTQMLAKGHDFENVTLTVLCDLDQTLTLPDFRSGERAFQLIVQAAGRAGRGQTPGKVLLQSRKVDHPVIKAALKHDFHAFAESELRLRQDHMFPPFGKMVHIELSAREEGSLLKYCQAIELWLNEAYSKFPEVFKKLKIIGPTLPPIELVRGRFRRTIAIFAPDHHAYRRFLTGFFSSFHNQDRRIRWHIDIDPQSLL